MSLCKKEKQMARTDPYGTPVLHRTRQEVELCSIGKTDECESMRELH